MKCLTCRLAAHGRVEIDPGTVREYLDLKTGSTRSVALCAIRAVYDGGLKLKVTEELHHHGKPARPDRPAANEAAELVGAAMTLTDMLLVLVADVFGLQSGQARDLKWRDLQLSGEVLTLADEHSVTGAAATLGPDLLRKQKGAMLGSDAAERQTREAQPQTPGTAERPEANRPRLGTPERMILTGVERNRRPGAFVEGRKAPSTRPTARAQAARF